MVRYFITDTNDQPIGNPRGYATQQGALREANHRLLGELQFRLEIARKILGNTHSLLHTVTRKEV